MSIISGLEKLLPIIEQFSPPVATALGMPYAGIIVNALCHIFGVNAPEELPGAISADTQAAQVKIKEIEAQVASIEAKSQVAQKEIEDRSSAREREKKLSDAQTKSPWIIDFLVTIVTGGFFSYLILYKFGLITFDRDIFRDLFTMQTIVLMYYF